MVYLFRVLPGRNICCILTVAVHIASILASPNCKNCLFGKCDEEGICTDGCEPGFADIFCQHPCQETCLKSRCFVDNHTGTTMCTDGCVDGFCYPACKIPCPEGCLRCERMLCESCTLCEGHLYGQSCQHSCFDKCKGYACSIEGNCSMDKCMDGRYGKSCNESCKPRYESCHQESGQCIKCRRGLFGDDCQNHCSHECLSMEEDMMFRCRSGCTLCQLPPHTDSKKDLGCTDNSMEAKINSALGLCSAVLLIAVTILCFKIKEAYEKYGRNRRENNREADPGELKPLTDASQATSALTADLFRVPRYSLRTLPRRTEDWFDLEPLSLRMPSRRSEGEIRPLTDDSRATSALTAGEFRELLDDSRAESAMTAGEFRELLDDSRAESAMTAETTLSEIKRSEAEKPTYQPPTSSLL